MRTITKEDLLHSRPDYASTEPYFDKLGNEYIVYTPDEDSAEYLFEFLNQDCNFHSKLTWIKCVHEYDKVGYRVRNGKVDGFCSLNWFRENKPHLEIYLLQRPIFEPIKLFRKGDKVRVREDLVTAEFDGKNLLISPMKNLAGHTIKIESVNSLKPTVYEAHHSHFYWAHEMFEKYIRVGEELIPYSENIEVI